MTGKKQNANLKGTVMGGSGRKRRPARGRVPGPENLYISKSILAHREVPPPTDPNEPHVRSVYFLVEWEGYSLGEATWEPFPNIENSIQMVKDYLESKGKQLKINKDTKEAWVEDRDEEMENAN